ncbi:MAG: hypothetical protein IT204_12890 [Fimbriimonadaceae bacterium]|nr:hypothetical protein [Fimbriimonadaceae bacterium]
MLSQGLPAKGLRVEIIHGGDSAQHQRRVLEWLALNGDVEVVDWKFCAQHDNNSRVGTSFSTAIVYREPAAG